MTIEVAHLYLNTDNTVEKIMHHLNSCELAMEHYSLDLNKRAIVLMVDDQKIKRKCRSNETLPYIGLILRHTQIDYLCFETDLNYYMNEWLEQQKNRVEVRREIKYEYNGVPQCSHYIAIWYLLRFGRINDTRNIMLPVSIRAHQKHIAPFDIECLTSILPITYRDVEDMTQKNILDQLIDPLPPIERIYYG